MAAGRARCRDDKPSLPTLTLGLSSVRFIVNQIEAECARVVTSDTFGEGRELVKYNPNIDEIDDDSEDFPLGPPRGRIWTRIAVNLGIALSRCIPSVTFGNFGIIAISLGLFAPKMISYLVIYPFCRLVFGTLYPAYASYKAVRTKNLKEYVKWMMYWIVFALFTCTETFTDMFLSWFPFYYEVKIVLVLWLLSPATKGSSILYRKFVHPALCRREQEIDEYIAKAKDQGYHTVLNLGTKGVNYATTVIMQTAIKGGGGLVQQIRKSYSLSDLTECEPRDPVVDEAADVLSEPRQLRPGGKSGYSTRRSASESNSRTPMYFPEVDVDVRNTRSARADEPDFSHIKSSEDISSGYSSADTSASLSRAGSVSLSGRRRTAITAVRRPAAAEESDVIIEELHDTESIDYANMPPLVNVPSPVFLSQSDPPFIYQYVGDQVRILQVLGNNSFIKKENAYIDPNLWKQIESVQKDIDNLEAVDINKTTVVNCPDTHNLSLNKGNQKIEATINDVTLVNDSSNDDNKEKILQNDDHCNPGVLQGVEPVISNAESISENKHEDNNNNNPDFVSDKITEKKQDNILLIIDENSKEQKEAFLQTDIEATSSGMSMTDDYSADSDDEASFGTPEDSPKAKRKSPKGKYGKSKAPLPPNVDITTNSKGCLEDNISATGRASPESLNDFINQLPNITDSGVFKGGLQVVNPIVEKKRRHKSKSPGRLPKSHGLGKLLQIPNKLVFWHKSEEKSKTDAEATSTHDRKRSSSAEVSNEFQSYTEVSLGKNTSDREESSEVNDDQLSFKDATDFENDIISNDIIEKSDALQKLIDAKIETYPEYKFVSLHEEIPTTSKSTDV